MKKVLQLLIIILSFYLIFNYFANKNSSLIQYKIENFSIKEHHDDTIYFEIGINGMEFNFKLFNKLNRKMIKEIKYYSDNDYKCILPIFKDNKVYTDIICLKNDVQYLYNTMFDKSENLVSFRNELSNYYSNTTDEIDSLDLLTIYKNNLLKDKYVLINSYKGIYILSKDIQKEIKLFENDIYNQTIKFLIDKYYIIADYNQNHDFSNFYVIDIESGKETILKTNYDISFDSIIQGVYDNKLYLYDTDSKIQYKIDPFKMNVSISGTEKKGIKIFNEELKTHKINEVKDFEFKYVEKVNNYNIVLNYFENENYYYLLNNNIYKASSNLPNKLTYLFKNNYDTIKYSKDYMCMLSGDTLYCYNELLGIKKIVNNKEFLFNKNLTYEVYSK